MSAPHTDQRVSRSKRSRRRFLAGAAATGATLSVAGCIGGGGGGGSDSIKVGLMFPLSGTYQLLGESHINGFKLRLKEIEETVGDREVETVKKDTTGDPNTGATVAQEFLNSEQVDFLVGPVSSAVAGAVKPIVEKSSAIWLNANAGNDDLTKKNCIRQHFRTGHTNWEASARFAPWMQENVSDNVVVAFADYSAGQQYRDNFVANFDGTIQTKVGAPLGTSDYSPYLQRIGQSDADACYAFFAGGDAVTFVKQFHSEGLDEDIDLAGPGFLLSADTLSAQGEAAVGKHSILNYTPTRDSETNNAFVEAYRNDFDRAPNVYACQGYDSALAMEHAVEQAGSLESDSLISALEGAELSGSPRGYLKLKAENHEPIHDLDIRKVEKGSDGSPRNTVVDTLEKVETPTWGCSLGSS